MKILFLFLCLLLSFFSYAQDMRAATWVFGDYNKVEFAENTPSHIYVNFLQTIYNNIFNGASYSSISNNQGKLVIYADIRFILQKDGSPISLIEDGWRDVGEVILVPKTKANNQYYKFHTNIFSKESFGGSTPIFFPPSMGYELVDSEAINEFGEVGKVLEKKTIRKANPISVKLAATQHKNQEDYWVLVHEWNNNTFVAYKLTEKGITDSTKTNIGSTFKWILQSVVNDTSLPNYNNFGQMKISPAGDMVALTMFAEKAIEVFSFNNSTGQLGCFRRYDLSSAMGADEYLYGIEISPNGRFVYVSSQKKIIEPYASSLYQIDLLEPNPQKAIQVIARGQSGYTGLQLAIDGKIYVARFYQQHLGVIHQPNLPYPACNFEEEGLYLNGNRVGIALNNIVSSFLPKSSPILELPNAFTPNGDGINDSFEPIRIEGVFVKDIRIYSSWGKEVHRANNFEQAWEGKNVPAGVYHYAITYHTGYLCEQNTQIHKGWVQVLK